MRGDLGAAQPGILRRHALGAAVHRDARRPRETRGRLDPFDRRRAASPRESAARRRIGARHTAFHPHRIALRDARHHRRPGHPATAPHAHDDRTAAPPRRPGTGQRRLPALRSVRSDPGRGNRRRRFRFVAVHHGAAAGAPALAASRGTGAPRPCCSWRAPSRAKSP